MCIVSGNKQPPVCTVLKFTEVSHVVRQNSISVSGHHSHDTAAGIRKTAFHDDCLWLVFFCADKGKIHITDIHCKAWQDLIY